MYNNNDNYVNLAEFSYLVLLKRTAKLPNLYSMLYALQFSRAPSIQVNTAPGTYSITAAQWREPSAQQQTNTTHIVKVEPGESVSLTLSV